MRARSKTRGGRGSARGARRMTSHTAAGPTPCGGLETPSPSTRRTATRTEGGLGRGSGCSKASRRSRTSSPRASPVTSPPRDATAGRATATTTLLAAARAVVQPAAPAPAP